MSAIYAEDQPAGFVNEIRRVAIVGAGGSVGTPITQALLDTGRHTVTALTRVGSSSAVPAGVETVAVDYDSPASLVAALQGQDCLIITLAVTAPPDTQSQLVQAAAQAGIRYIMPNVWGCDVLHDPLARSGLQWDRSRAIFAEIEATGVCAWVALVCGFWYEHSLVLGPGAFGFDFPHRQLTLNDDGRTRISISTQAQCGRAVATLLSLPVLPDNAQDPRLALRRWHNQAVYIASFRLSQRDMFDSWLRVAGDRAADWTLAQAPATERYRQGMERLRQGDRSGFVQAMYSRVFFPNGDGDHESRRGLDNARLGLPVEELDAHTRQAKAMVDRGYNYMSNRN
ncbi:oxidoreductase CipA-like protein [Aspergillus heteromorphus CBS 117.55]|uniref:Oxidoreductase CipA-like protein n=1 Tax=Aspergillus heteromorphus CBS 117.55 TaxID=1448321 RepID=A0A317WDN2_9EURO|nr:oxidoreductase CipA-like protein [Aspergillus heteromorphus CBS 117.55]PWY83332.1 oxidoreductase CipA-like protein [Aspergillus heteromorphus CBS 117.55]